MAKAPKDGKLLYHITELHNVPSIYREGLCSRSTVHQARIQIFDIADHEILEKRDMLPVQLSHFIPFHFFAKNPFDGDVCKTYGSENMAIIAINRDLCRKYEFFISPKHPLGKRDDKKIYPYNEGLEMIDWDKMNPENNRDYRDPDIKSTCLAECLVNSTSIPFSDFTFIFVKTEQAKNYIQTKCGVDLLSKVRVNPLMFP